MTLAAVSLDDKYALESGRVYINGVQALVRLPMMQRRRDEAAGLNTACFITGYRGSPLGSIDQQLWQARKFIDRHHIHFQPGVNEDLAATAVWGSQQIGFFPGARYDGVFAMWYAKGPGVDRSGDALRHANLAGTAPNGGVLALAGDDHTCKSSTTAHQTEYAFMDAMIPVLHPAGVQDFLDLGLYGWAMSRFSGAWTAFKVVAETADSSASVIVDPHRIEIVQPTDFVMPPGGLHLRIQDTPLEQEARLHEHKLRAVLAFARANRLDRTIWDSPARRLGIVTAGKSYLDVRQALDDLGIGEDEARAIGLSIYKLGMTWPLEPEGIRAFAEGLDEVLVVEEKRPVIEGQLKEIMYNWPADRRPRVSGKYDETGAWQLPSKGELTPAGIARVIAARLRPFHTSDRIEARLRFIDERERALEGRTPALVRTPYFCSGCPHNSSTKVPEGSRALSGIGCHFMAQWMDRNTSTFTQMGGEGAPWIGQEPFTDEKHVFVNIGDGTYFHSGLLAIRMAVAADANMTYKILYNDAVAMTGGQPMDGPLNPQRISFQLYAEGVKRIAVVTDEPDKYAGQMGFAPGVTVHHRDELDAVQKLLRETPGVTGLIYDQTCAAEKRRRRKRGTFPDPARRVFINEAVCEGCGDCSVKSNCVSVVPVETEFGRKRRIDQSSCNKDFSCLNGFCPSFVTVEGGDLRKPAAAAPGGSGKAQLFEALPEPVLPDTSTPYGILVTGVGGTGVVTIGALLGMAAHLEGRGCTVLDMTGLAQKGGAVVSHVRIADRPEDIHAVRVAAGGARLILGCDEVVAASNDVLAKVDRGATQAVINTEETITGDFTRNPDYRFPGKALQQGIAEAVGADRADFIAGTRLATALLGNSIATNMFMLGFAWQKGLVPISREALEQAIDLNRVGAEANKRAFLWGRRAAFDIAAVERIALPPEAAAPETKIAETLDEMVARRMRFLAAYQDVRLAARYKALVDAAQQAEAQAKPGADALARAVARYWFKLLAYKDEYEVARLYAETDFRRRVASTFEGSYRLNFHLAPPLFARRDPETGQLKKRAYGPWVLHAFRLLAKFRRLRGTPLDVFGYTEERRAERQLIAEYEATMRDVLSNLTAATHATAVDLASVPEQIRGYGHVKERSMHTAAARRAALLAAFRNPAPPQASAAE
ncbi:MAG: indolepyruvate ferredoxin oxidoreductase family protein [Alphaproteobacteria bacterium]